MEQEDDAALFLTAATPQDRQDMLTQREFARRRPVRHDTVNDLQEQVNEGILEIQKRSPNIRRMFQFIQSGIFPETKTLLDPELVGFVRARARFKVKKGLVYRIVSGKEALVLPASMIPKLYTEYHEQGGHMSAEQTYTNITDSYYVYGLLSQLHLFISRCSTCELYSKRGIGNSAPKMIYTDRPNKKLFLDVIGPLQESVEKCSYVLLGTDGNTRFAVGRALEKIDGVNIVKALKLMYISLFSYPQNIIVDNGLNSVSLREFCSVNSIVLTFLSSYHPQSNIQERCNGSIKKILYRLYNDRQKQWDEILLAQTIYLYNISIHSSLGFSPFYLFLGRKPEIPLDLFLNTTEAKNISQTEYLKDLQTAISRVVDNAFDAYSRSQNLCARRTNLRNAEYVANDPILVRNFRKSGKMEPNFLKGFRIVRQVGPSTYLVKNEQTNRYSKINIRDIKRDHSHRENVDTQDEGLPLEELGQFPAENGQIPAEEGHIPAEDGQIPAEGQNQGKNGQNNGEPKQNRLELGQNEPNGSNQNDGQVVNRPDVGQTVPENQVQDGQTEPGEHAELEWKESVEQDGQTRTRAGRVVRRPQRYQ